MIIYNTERQKVLELVFAENKDDVFGTYVIANLLNEETQTDLHFESYTSLCYREMKYIHDCYDALYKKECIGFGFTTFDRVLSIWVCRKGCELMHDVVLNDTRYKSPYRCQCKIHFSSSDLYSQEVHSEIESLVKDISEKKASCQFDTLPLSISFSALRNGAWAYKMEILSPFFRIKRNLEYYAELQDLSNLKEQIILMKEKKKVEFCISDEYLDVRFQLYDDLLSVEGEISDFTWPETNDVSFHELVPITVLDSMLDSINSIINHDQSRGL